MAGNDGRELLLPAEAPAGLHLNDADSILRQVEEPGKRVVDVVRALHRAPHRHAVRGVGDRQHAIRLDVELLLRARLVFPLDDDRGRRQRGVDVAPSTRCSS